MSEEMAEAVAAATARKMPRDPLIEIRGTLARKLWKLALDQQTDVEQVILTALDGGERAQQAEETVALIKALLNRDMPTSRLDLFRNAENQYVVFTPDSTLDRSDPERLKVRPVEPCADLLPALRALAAQIDGNGGQEEAQQR